ncbi:unnamed protein product [Spirodela intermedia]|uniref:CID domain-containing protein n=1 Tax=Spirodela intermedia TaxID=51605 RepID=A0A7I8JBU5_SPIIN|nr:unnamed protein product [Spirodela intermedia]CAA6667570.1 unnamed protein product [Spirodela intermedia]
MEMESSRRSLDRSKEPGLLKKPRLGELAERDPRGVLAGKGAGPDRDRPFLPRAAAPLAGGAFRVEDQPAAAFRGPSYQQQQQMQELAAQYKSALAELTFNSKPIITNLTIIAGESLHAAKAIAAVICTNILEVPSDQKLPSLYLLDSIVKNIGRDYIKYFAARLPEVFCKAYKQVDSSIHQGMRHLFGTWKGVFPPAPLMIIEKELGFPPIVNGSSSGGTGSRPDSQAQRPPHSIHVNPKYLEARQQLQQPSRVKAANGDNVGKASSTMEAVERADRVSTFGSSRQWVGPSIKAIQRPQRELSNEPAIEKNSGQGYGDREFVSDYSRHSDSGVQRASGRFAEREVSDKPWSSIRKGNHETMLGERTSSEVDRAGENHRISRSGQTVIQPSTNKEITTNMGSVMASQNWKNSEEEEYTWDLNPTGLQRGRRITPDVDHLQGPWNKLDSVTRLGKPSGKEDRLIQSKELAENPPTASFQQSRQRSNREHSADSVSRGATFGHRAPGLWSSHEMNVSLVGSNNATSRITGQEDSYSIPGNSELSTEKDLSFPKIGGHHMGPTRADTSSNLGPLANAKSKNSADHGPLGPEKPVQSSGQLNLGVSSAISHDSFPSTGLQNAIPRSNTLPNSQQLLPKISQTIKKQPHSSTQSEESLHPSLSLGSLDNGSNLMSNSTANSSGGTLDHSSTSKLLAAIAKSGLISITPSSSLESLISQPPLPASCITHFRTWNTSIASRASSILLNGYCTTISIPLTDGSSALPASTSMPLATTLDSCAVPPTSSPNELSRLESSSPKGSVLSKKSSADAEGLIGLKFRPEVIREYHLEVINRLYDLKHQDVTCEGRFKSQEEIQRYFNWHASKSNVGDSDQASLKDELVNTSLEMVMPKSDNCEPVVPADEGQCICALCGEPFEDVYCEERDEWMYKGTVYMSPPGREEAMEGSDVESTPQGLVVHAQCKSRNANDEFEAAIVKMESDGS